MYFKKISTYFILFLLASCSDSSQQNNKKDESSTKLSSDIITEAVVDNENTVAEEKKAIQENLSQEQIEPQKSLEKVLDQNQVFERFKERFLKRNWELFPSKAVYQGYYKHDDQLLTPNGELRAFRRAFFVSELQAVKGFDAIQLSPENATDLAIIEGHLKSSIWYIDSFRSYEWNPAEYNPAGTFGIILNTDYKPFLERLDVIIKRLESVPHYYEAALSNLKVPTLEHLGLAIEQSKGALSMFRSVIPSTVESQISEGLLVSEEQNKALQKGLDEASLSVQSYISWLVTKQAELKQSGEARDFRIGAELYEKKFAYDIESNYTAEGLYQLALEAKDKLHTQMVSITKELWGKYFPETPLPENDLVAVKQLIDKLSLKHIERDKFVDEIRRQIPIIQKFMDDKQLLDSDPSRPLVVRLTPEYQRGFAGASVNAPGPYDATANTYYNVSPLDGFTDEQAESYLREYNHWILQVLNIHEAIPGHYTQLMHANKSPSKIKSIFGNGAMVEGWAVYSERMMLENGYGNNEPEMWLMYSKWNLRVVVNTLLDYSVQVLGMEQEAALDLLMNEAFQQRAEAEGKWRRATVSQVQLTSYFSGFSEIYSFREELKKQMSDRFNLREFHNKFLSYGNAPVPVIKKLMLADLESQLEADATIDNSELQVGESNPDISKEGAEATEQNEDEVTSE